MKKLVLPEKRSVKDFIVMGGINGDDAIDPGAPPTCFGAPCGTPPPPPPPTAGAWAGGGAWAMARFRRLRPRLRLFFDMD